VLVKEVPGGCICCAQNLPLQIALGQIATRADIHRLLIEPTGLGHPEQILETLREPHWRQYLKAGATLCLVDARQLGDERVTTNETFRAQVGVADVLLFSKADLLDAAAREQALVFAAGLRPEKALTAFVSAGSAGAEGGEGVDAAWLDAPPRQPVRQRRSLLHLRPAVAAVPVPAEPQEPPYHYHEQADAHGEPRWIGGWILPADWCFRHDDLITALMGWRGLERLKGVFHTDRGWIHFNATALDLSIKSSEYRADSRVEAISAQPVDWSGLEAALLATLAPGEQQQ